MLIKRLLQLCYLLMNNYSTDNFLYVTSLMRNRHVVVKIDLEQDSTEVIASHTDFSSKFIKEVGL